jgi:hypothetical protein
VGTQNTAYCKLDLDRAMGSPAAKGLLAAGTPASFVINRLYETTEIRL